MRATVPLDELHPLASEALERLRRLGVLATMVTLSLAAGACGTSEETGSVGDELTANGLAITVLEVDRRVPRPARDVTGLALPSPGYELVGVRVRACNEHGSALGPWAFGVDGSDGTKARPKYPTRNYARVFEPVRDTCGSGWLVFELPKGVAPAKVRFDFQDTGGVRPGTDRDAVDARFEWTLDAESASGGPGR